MRRIIAVAVIVVFIFTMILPTAAIAAPDYNYIKVKLASMGSPSSVQFKVAGAYYLNEADHYLYPGITYTIKTDGTTQTLTYNNGVSAVSVNLPASVTMERHANGAVKNFLYVYNPSCGWRYYAGDMTISRAAGVGYFQLVNTLFIEEYLYGVIAYEMSNEWPAEALKAQAICARTYAMRLMQTNAGSAYHIVDTTFDQVYKGFPYNSDGTPQQNVIKAVDTTRGMVITTGAPAQLNFASGKYSASNGGQIRYTAKDDSYDLRNASSPAFTYIFPVENSTAKLNLLSASDKSKVGTMITLLKDKLPAALLAQQAVVCTATGITVNGIKSVTPLALRTGCPEGSKEFTQIAVTVNVSVTGATPAATATPALAASSGSSGGGGMPADLTCDVTVILVYMSGASWSIPGELRTQFATYSSLLSSSSLWLMYQSASSDGNFLYVTVRGYGHGVGMSQRGAQQMAKELVNYADIIDFYYNTKSDSADITTVNVAQKALTALPGRSGTKVYGKVYASSLNVRAADSTSAVVVGNLTKDTVVEILETAGTWYKVLKPSTGIVGYCSSVYVKSTTETPSGLPTASPLSTLAPTATPTPVATATAPATTAATATATPAPVSLLGSVKASTLYMRSQASTTGSVVYKLKKGDAITVLDSNAAANWYKVKFASYTGYCMYQSGATTYISLLSTSATGGATASATTTATAGATATATAGITPSPVSATVKVSGYLTLRSSASTTSSKLGQIANGTKVTVLQVPTTATWLKVTYSGKTGFIMNKYAVIGGNSTYSACTVTVAQLNVRSGAGTGNSVIGILKSGDTLLVTGKTTASSITWYKIAYGSGSGYIDSRYVRISKK